MSSRTGEKYVYLVGIELLWLQICVRNQSIVHAAQSCITGCVIRLELSLSASGNVGRPLGSTQPRGYLSTYFNVFETLACWFSGSSARELGSFTWYYPNDRRLTEMGLYVYPRVNRRPTLVHHPSEWNTEGAIFLLESLADHLVTGFQRLFLDGRHQSALGVLGVEKSSKTTVSVRRSNGQRQLSAL